MKRVHGAMALLLFAGAASAQTSLPAWIILPAWQQPIEAVKTAEGDSAESYEPQPDRQVAGFDHLLSTPMQIDSIAVRREFYFDQARKLSLVRIIPVKTNPANCDAVMAATMGALGKQDEQSRAAAIPLELMDRRYWFRNREDRLYNWIQFKSLRGPDANTPCFLIVEPYKAGMARKKKG